MWRTFVLKYGKAGEKKVNKSNGRSLRFRALVCLQSAVLEKRGSEWWACQLVMGDTSQRGRRRTEGARREGGVVWAINQRCCWCDRVDFVWPVDYVAAENTAETNLCMLLDILWTPVINQSEDNYIIWTSFLSMSPLPSISLQLTFTFRVFSKLKPHLKKKTLGKHPSGDCNCSHCLWAL